MEKMPSAIHESWHKYLQPLFDNPKMIMIKNEVLSAAPYYPDRENIFRVFSMPLQEIKVVIIGQDPYPNGEAIGLAFGINKISKMPASLRVINNEITKSMNKGFDWTLDVTLQKWFNQGVFLLNAALTVERKQAGSHIGYWEWFTREVISIIAKEVSPIWLLWGSKAQSFNQIIRMNETGLHSNSILEAPHPAAELYGGNKKFTGCNHFNLCNEILQSKDKVIIDW